MTDSKQEQTVEKFTEITTKFMAENGQGHYQMEQRGTSLDLAWYEDNSIVYLTLEVSDSKGPRKVEGQIEAANLSSELNNFVLSAVRG